MTPTIVYIADSRLPTEKAHGFQIAKMCEAMSSKGAQVELWHPSRWQRDRALRGESLFDYYGIDRTFRDRKLPNVDLVALVQWLPSRVFGPVHFVRGLLWALMAVTLVRLRRRPSIVYTRVEAVAFWATLLRLPTVFEAHVAPVRGRCWLLRRASTRLTVLAPLTTPLRDALARDGIRCARTLVLPDAVDLRGFTDLPTRAEARARVGLDGERPIVGYVGRFVVMGNEKGLPTLVQAMGQFARVGPPPLLVCVGGPVDAIPALEQTARAAGLSGRDVCFHDRVPNTDVPVWIRALDIAVIPSPDTPFFREYSSPLKLFEYLAAGAAVVASDLPALRDILVDGENAVLVPPDDVCALASALGALVADPAARERLGDRARADAGKYTWAARARAVLDAAGVRS